MSIYFIAIFLTIIILDLIKFEIPEIKGKKILLASISALPLSIVAGLRTADIGTDIGVYGSSSFNLATNCSNFSEYWHLVIIKYGTESGYAWLNYIVSRFTSNLNVFLFVLSFLTLWVAFEGALTFEKSLGISVEIQILIYFSIIYGTSLNMMRQALAMSMIFWGTSLLIQRKRHNFLASLLLFGLAFLFHRTAIISVGIYIIYLYLIGISKNWRRKINYFFFPWAVPLAAIGVPFIFNFFINNTSFSKYTMYLEDGNWLESTSKGLSRIFLTTGPSIVAILLVTIILLANSYFKLEEKTKQILIFFGIILLLDIITQFTAISGQVIARLGLYFVVFEMIAIPFVIQKFLSKYSAWLIYVIVIFYYLYLFYHLTIVGTGQIYPYQWILP